ncbi:zinc-dependent alcohol dehydrogenase [Brachybacterium vulturis]|uniref:zinc-dependent alcohol dehydrogenase n=1 Tax=Brachybacterium vulturis TaxID=2017484 RepID=UPI001C44AA5F|nr:alcohol dehydrogenase catalytic domain-containing protein [Brachybacterium vulturis]
MKAIVVNADGRVQVKEIDRPDVKSHQALVATIAGGICGTDATLLQCSFKGVGPASYPLVLGHESVGRVIDVGEDVISYKRGDIVLLPFVPQPSADGQNLGSAWGAFSEFTLVDDAAAFATGKIAGLAPEAAFAQSIVPASIDPVDATVIITLREVLSGIRVSGIDLGQPIIIYGSGPVAMAFTALLRQLCAEQLIAVVRSDEKAELMRRFGASSTINSCAQSVQDGLRDLEVSGVGAVIDAVGSASVINEGIPLLQDRGIMFCYGVPKTHSMDLEWSEAPYNWTLKFQQFPRKDEEGECHQQIVDWAECGDIVLSKFISEIVPVDDSPELFERYLAGRTSGKIVLKF